MNLSEAEFQQLSELISQAIDLPEVERSEWATRAAGGDADLERLLRLALNGGSAGLLAPLDPARRFAAIAEARRDRRGHDALDRAGDLVGPYRLLRLIGTGGMGTVWLAERADGTLQRQVALKLPKGAVGPLRREEIRRERDILAALEHPSIARLYDAGVTSDGRPYLAMEYVDGRAIDAHVRDRALSIEQRLHLFLEVARAVAFAHGRLVVHRDLKPLNILVDSNGRIRLLDFGIAKLLEDAPGSGPATLPAQRPFTPEYASPEQISGKRITVASDVYSLGVVLFELLAGRRPYTLEQVAQQALDPAVSLETPLASARVQEPRLRRMLSGDLDTIVAKAMKRDPEERYANVEAFADDVERHLRREPVRARPDSGWYRLRRYARRNRLALAGSTIVAVAIIGGAAAATWQAQVARREARRAERVKSFVASIFTQATPREGVGGAVTAADLLAAAATRVESELSAEPAAAAELGVLIGEGFSSLGEPMRGAPALTAAVERAERELGHLDPLTLHGRTLLVESQTISEDFAAAETLLAQLVPDLVAGLPKSAIDCVQSLRSLSFVQAKRDRAEASYASLRQAIEIGERHLGPNDLETITAIGLLANTYGRFAERTLQLETAAEALKRATAAFGSKRPSLTLTNAERWYAEALSVNDRPRDAAVLLRTVLRDQLSLDASETIRVMNAKLRLSQALASTGRMDEGLPMIGEAVALERRLHPAPGDDRRGVVTSLGKLLALARFPEEAQAALREAAQVNRSLGELKTTTVRITLDEGWVESYLGQQAKVARTASAAFAATTMPQQQVEARVLGAFNARLDGRYPAAIELAKDALARSANLPGIGFLRSRARTELGLSLLESGAAGEAAPILQDAWEELDRAQVEPSILSSDCALGLARIDLAAGRTHEAERRLAPIEESWSKTNPDSPFHGEVLFWQARSQTTGGERDLGAKTLLRAKTLLAGSPIPALRKL